MILQFLLCNNKRQKSFLNGKLHTTRHILYNYMHEKKWYCHYVKLKLADKPGEKF